MTQPSTTTLEVDDIQGIILRDRPFPYFGAYLLLRIDNPAQGCLLLRRLAPRVVSGINWQDHTDMAWFNVAFTFEGLKALGVPEASLASFAPEFQQGMAARAQRLGDVGESAPINWEKPFGTPEVHVALSFFSGDRAALQPLLELAQSSQDDLAGVTIIYRVDIAMLPTTRTHFGYQDGIGIPLIEGSGSAGYPGQGPAIKAGEFLLGYPDETGNLPAMPQPETLGRNGRSASTCEPTHRAPRMRNGSKPKSWAAGPAGPRSSYLPNETTRPLVPMPNATTTSCTTMTTPTVSNVRSGPTSGVRIRAMR